jgi:hypothetical protein
MWNVSSLRGSKTLSQFPAASSNPTGPGTAIPLKNRVASAPKLASSTLTLNGIIPGDISPKNLSSLRQTGATSANGMPWATTVPSLCSDNPVDEWLGAACMVFALAEMLCEIPELERLTTSIVKTEVNTRGELILARQPFGELQGPGESARTEAMLVEELVDCLVAATKASVNRDASARVAGDERSVGPNPSSNDGLPVWLNGLPTGADRPTRVAEFAMWLGLQLSLPRSQQADEIRLWVRRRRRLAQSQEGVMMHQLGGVLTCLSSSPLIHKASDRPSGWVWLSVLTIVLGVGLAAHFLLR